jgi:predicted RNase H-like HicB family nuclease
MLNLKVTIETWQKGRWFLAKIPELDFVSQGRTLDGAKANLFEVVKIQFDEMREQGSLDEYLSECGFLKKGDIIEPQSEIMGFSGLIGGHFNR